MYALADFCKMAFWFIMDHQFILNSQQGDKLIYLSILVSVHVS